MSERRQVKAGAGGVPAISFIEDFRNGRRVADLVEVIGPDAADVVMAQLSGWSVAAPVELGRELLDRGARFVRHAHEMWCDLAARPPAPADPPEGFRFVPCDRPPRDVLGAWLAAYPPGHPDHGPRDAVTGLDEKLAPLLTGRGLGAVLACSALAVRADDDEVVAGVVMTDRGGGPWISEVFRHPDRSPRGLGYHLLGAVLARAEAAGLTTVGLAVTEGNPARRIYERLGFTVTHTALTVIV